MPIVLVVIAPLDCFLYHVATPGCLHCDSHFSVKGCKIQTLQFMAVCHSLQCKRHSQLLGGEGGTHELHLCFVPISSEALGWLNLQHLSSFFSTTVWVQACSNLTVSDAIVPMVVMMCCLQLVSTFICLPHVLYETLIPSISDNVLCFHS